MTLASGNGATSDPIDLYRNLLEVDPGASLLPGVVEKNHGPYVWGNVWCTDNTRINRAILVLQGSNDGTNWENVHWEFLQRGSFENLTSVPAIRCAAFGPVFVPFRFVKATLYNGNYVSRDFDVRMYAGDFPQEPAGRSYVGPLGRHAAFHYVDDSHLSTLATRYSPLICTDPGIDIVPYVATLAAMSSAAEFVCVDGDNIRGLVSIQGSVAGAQCDVSLLVGLTPAWPLPVTRSTDNLVGGGNEVWDTEDLTFLGGVGAGVRFPPKVSSPWIQLKEHNPSGVNDAASHHAFLRVARD